MRQSIFSYLLTSFCLLQAGACFAGCAPLSSHKKEISVWEGATAGSYPHEPFVSPDITVRQLLRSSSCCESLRIRINNTFGNIPLTIKEAWVGISSANGVAQLMSGSNKRIFFGKSPEITIEPGKEAWSDLIPISVKASEQIAVSLYAPFAPISFKFFPCFAMNPPAMYISTLGNHAAEEAARSFPSTYVNTGFEASTATGYQPGQIWWIDLVSTPSAEAQGSIVCLGDSITEGYIAFGAPGQRWTDVLSERFNNLPKKKRLSVINAAISGNTIHIQPNPYDPGGNYTGQPAVVRLNRDVLSVPGLKGVILLEGINDIYGGPFAPPSGPMPVIDAMKSIIARVHALGVPIIGGTLIPMGVAPNDAREQARLIVNQWMKEEAPFDAIIDFDAFVRDPEHPWQILPAYATPKTEETEIFPTHPNAVGHAIMGTRIPLKVFKDGFCIRHGK